MQENIYKYRILIIDFGSQYTKLIAKCIRKLGVYCEIWAWSITELQIRKFDPNGIILSGSPESVTKQNSPYVSQYIFEAGVPILGICYGMHVMVMQLGGHVISSNKREFGYTQVEINIDNMLTHGIKDLSTINGNSLLNVWMSHNDKVTVIPINFISVARTEACPFAIIVNEVKQFYGVQFHPEVTHTRKGMHILRRFVNEICRCKSFWIPTNIVNNIVESIRQQIGHDRVILGFSGGVDSYVTAALLHRAIGTNLICIFVDNGLLRWNESKQVIDVINDIIDLNVIQVKAENRFISALCGIKDPEEKRKIIGKIFVEIFNEEASKLGNVKWLAQGTIYPDIIESVTLVSNKKTHIIKSHHNVGGLPKNMEMKLIEPLKELFKDEVRKIGLELGLPYDRLYRHPFPGPGLSVRILGEVKKEYCDIIRSADAIFIEELHKTDFYYQVSQAFAIFLPLRSVSIMGDSRKYDWIIALRAVETTDFMTANWSHLPYKLLDLVSSRIINEVDGVSRVVYDISNKPPATIEWE